MWSSSKALRCCDLEQFDQEGRWALSSVTSADDDGGKSQRGVAGKVSRGKSSADQWGLGLGARGLPLGSLLDSIELNRLLAQAVPTMRTQRTAEA